MKGNIKVPNIDKKYIKQEKKFNCKFVNIFGLLNWGVKHMPSKCFLHFWLTGCLTPNSAFLPNFKIFGCYYKQLMVFFCNFTVWPILTPKRPLSYFLLPSPQGLWCLLPSPQISHETLTKCALSRTLTMQCWWRDRQADRQTNRCLAMAIAHFIEC